MLAFYDFDSGERLEMQKSAHLKLVSFPDGQSVPALGQGTYHMGEDKGAHDEEVAALRLGIDLGLTLIDTAEMYAEGGAEKVVADAIEGQRDRVFIVTKVYPHNASRTKMPKACEASLKRLRIESIDLYLLHWESEFSLSEIVEAFENLRAAGKIRRWGVSNFDLDQMKELEDSPCSANQVLYNLQYRGIEFDLLPWSQKKKMPIMAYSPVGHGRGLLNHATLKTIADRHSATPAQIALCWALRNSGVIAIPKATAPAHVRANAQSADIKLSEEEIAQIDHAFPPPKAQVPLAFL